MTGNTFGKQFTLTTFGESHGAAIGGVLDGVPPGIVLDIDRIQAMMDRRRPGASTLVTPRNEDDKLHIMSGVFEGKTLGTPIAFYIHNTNHQSKDYDALKGVFRPGHGDYTYYKKYGHVDHRGGGRASARETAARVAAGAIAHQVIEHILGRSIVLRSCVIQLGTLKVDTPTKDFDWDLVGTTALNCPSAAALPQWQAYLEALKKEGKSCGAVIFAQALNLPTGLGEPIFDKLDAELAKAMMSINAVKSVAIGETFDCASADVGFDEMSFDEQGNVVFDTNHAGGTLAGISTGQPLNVLVGFKPTSSTLQPRHTTRHDGAEIVLAVEGRHDACVALRACPIVEAMFALTLTDQLLRFRGQCETAF